MAGKQCTGAKSNNAMNVRSSIAFCEGVNYRAGGTALQRPKADNPHVADSEAAVGWDAGWDAAAGAAGGTMDGTEAPCCACKGLTILA